MSIPICGTTFCLLEFEKRGLRVHPNVTWIPPHLGLCMLTFGPVSLRSDGDIAVVTVDNPPVNALSHAVRQGLVQAVAALQADDGLRGAVLACAGRTFIAGADIREFSLPPQDPWLPEVIDLLEASAKPIIAALHGTTLGGGLEVALGCHHRVIAEGASVGLPEVTLGLLPGAGGTQRLPRLTGIEAAIDIITGGRPLPAAKALKLGMVDAVVAADGAPVDQAIAFLRAHLDQPHRRTRDLPIPPLGDDTDLEALKADVTKKARGQIAPIRAFQSVTNALTSGFDDAVKAEREIFAELKAGEQSKALRHAFFAERAVQKVPGLDIKTALPLASLGVVGGGTMGAGITVSMLQGGCPVTMVEMSEEAAARGRTRVADLLDGFVSRGKMTAEARDALLADKLTTATDKSALADCDLVIEAVFEDMAVKQALFAELDGICKPQTILATNTSYLDVDAIAAATGRPDRVLGLHFFSPAQIMRLVEVVIGAKTAPDVAATGFAFVKQLGKIGVRAGVCDGFIGNRMMAIYRSAADHMLEDGAGPDAIDAAVRNFGYAVGPYQMADMAGLDIGWANRKRVAPTRNPDLRYVEIGDRICEQGWFGQKTGQGFYLWDDRSKGRVLNPEAEVIIAAERARRGITPRAFSEEEIIERYLAAMINEGAKLLDEGIALRPLDVDVVKLHGYAFPRYRGGPMHYADSIGLPTVLDSLRRLEADEPLFWRPAPLLERLVAEGKSFADLNVDPT